MEEEKRRHKRNLRKQQRSSWVSQKIRELCTLLTESKIPIQALQVLHPHKRGGICQAASKLSRLCGRKALQAGEHYQSDVQDGGLR